MADIMPTLLELYGVPPPVKLDGRSLCAGEMRALPAPGGRGQALPSADR